MVDVIASVNHWARVVAAVCAICFLAAGCGRYRDQWTEQRPKTVPVTGEVLYKGAPLADAVVTFTNREAGRSATGTTDRNGRFRLTTFEKNDGAVPGKQEVSIRKGVPEIPGTNLTGMTKEELQAALNKMSEAELRALPLKSQLRWEIPERYGSPETSGLTAEVVDGGENHFRFELRD